MNNGYFFERRTFYILFKTRLFAYRYMSKFIVISAIIGISGVVLGAFGAHGLEERLLENGHLDNWRTATLYLFVHAIALLVVSQSGDTRMLRSVGWFWTIGIALFSGSLYILAVTGITKLGMVTPFGGLCFLIGWVLVAWNACTNRGNSVEGG